MNAQLNHSFEKGFILSEESIIKIDDIIKMRLQGISSTSDINYRVDRSDGMTVFYESAADVAAEENSARNSVRRVSLYVEGEDCIFRLVFNKDDDVELNIKSKDRDFAYLLSSDIKDYLNSEVMKFRKFSFNRLVYSSFFFPSIILCFLVIMLILSNNPGEDALNAALVTSDIGEKINYLIKKPSTNLGHLWWLIGVMFIILTFSNYISRAIDALYPRSVFYWGKQMQKYDSLVQRRERWVWGVIIAFIVSLIAGVVLDKVKIPDFFG